MNCRLSFGFFTLLVLFLSMGRSEGKKCKKTDLVFAIDGSISIGYGNFDRQIKFLASVVKRLPISPFLTKVSIIQFSDRWSTAVEMDLGNHKGRKSVVAFLKKMQYSQGYSTLTGKAFKLANEQLFGIDSRHGVEKVLVLITDGRPHDVTTLNYELKLLKDKGVHIVSIAVGNSYSQINLYKYTTRSMAADFESSFKSLYRNLDKKAAAVADAICERRAPPIPVKGIKKRCFQEKRDVVFAIEGSRQVSDKTFNKAMGVISKITAGLDIAPSIIHVSLVQFSDFLNTRIEFDLGQYTKMYKVNQSLNKIVRADGSEANLGNALNVIDTEIFSGDRMSAEDSLILFTTDNVKSKNDAIRKAAQLQAKGVQLVVIGLGKNSEESIAFYEKLVFHPNDVSHIDNVHIQHILGDVATTVCKNVICDKEKQKEKPDCLQQKQDVLFMLDGSRTMEKYFDKSKRFFMKIIKKLNIAVSNTHVGFMQFDMRVRKTRETFMLGRFKFERDIRNRVLRAKQRYRPPYYCDIAAALKRVNNKVFNKPTSGNREDARDLIFIATRGKTVSRLLMQREVKALRKKGVTIAVLDVGYKDPVRGYQNVVHDMASGPQEIFPLDFKRISSTSQSIVAVECKVKESTASSSCFQRKRKVLYMLDTSAGLHDYQIPTVLNVMANITQKLYSIPSNIAIGLLQYSDPLTAKIELPLRSRPLQSTLDAIKNLKYRKGHQNHLGIALRTVNNRIFPESSVKNDEEKVIILVTHSEVASPRKAFKYTEILKRRGVHFMIVVIHTMKKATNMNAQYKSLSTSPTNTYVVDYTHLAESAENIMMNLCELKECPEDTTKKCSPKKQDIFMVVDSSRSIGKTLYPQLVRFVKRFVNKLDVAPDLTNVGIIQASDPEKTEFEMKLSQYKDLRSINKIIEDMNYHYGKVSLIGKAIEKAVKDNLYNGSSDRPNAENILMIFTDGVFHDEHLAKKMVTLLKQRNVRVVVIGLGEQSRKLSSKTLLRSMASTPSDVYLIHLNGDFLSIEAELNEIVQHVRTLDCINMYKAPIQCEPETVDVFVAIDGSRSVSQRNFEKVQEFLQKLAGEFDIGKNKAHFGLLQYGSIEETRIEFNMDKFDSNEKVNEAIQNMSYLASHMTETGKTLELLNRQIFSGQHGDRPNVPNILILFTDGVAHDIKTAYREAAKLKNRGVRIVGIGAGRQVRMFFDQLQKIASSPADAHKSDFNKLGGVIEDFLDIVCT